MKTHQPFFASLSWFWLITAWVGHSLNAHAQTLFTHDAAGNRVTQVAAGAPSAPLITAMPADQVAPLGGTARFSVLAGGPGPFTYQWFKGTSAISGATSDTLVLENLTATDFTPSPLDSPKYSVQVTNAHSTVQSFGAGLYQDSVGTGLPNWWRQQYFGSLGAVDPNEDADNDGVTNAQEYADGTQPNNAASRLSRVLVAGPQALMRKYPDQPTYAGGSVVSVLGMHSGELQFGGFTGSFRSQAGMHAFFMPGGAASSADVFVKGLYGSMPVQKDQTSPTFTYSDGSAAAVTGLATSPWGSWIAWGYFNRVNGQPRGNVAAFYPDDTLQAGFTPQPNAQVNDAAILPNGRVILAGYFNQMNGQPRPGVAEFDGYGFLDTSFVPNFQGGGTSFIDCLALQGDGKILLGGQISASTVRYVVRLNADGTTDTTFTPTMDGDVTALRQQPDGKILMGGRFTTVNGTATPKLVRLNLDGTLDSSFNLVVTNGAVTSEPRRLIVQPDGKILVGGNVQVRLNGSTVNVPVARLNANGTLDSAFTQKIHTLAAGLTFADITLQTDGRIVGVGTFTLSSPSVVNAVRFNADGSVDPDCFVISRPNGPVYAVAAQVNDNLLIGGAFSDVAVGTDAGNDHRYFITPAKTGWHAAEALAVKLGGNLLSIGGPTEQNFATNTLLPLMGLSQYPVWIGFTDNQTEGLYRWSSGEPVGYNGWNPGEPNGGTNENFAAMNWAMAYNSTGAGKWVDVPEAGTNGLGGLTQGPYYGIIEVDPASAAPTTNHWVAGRDMLANENAGLSTPPSSSNQAVPAWSYGQRSTPASTSLTLFSSIQRHADGIFKGWNAPNDCAVLVSTSSFPGFYLGPRPLHPGEMYLHPGSDLAFSVVRWTAPEAGTYAVSAFWQDFSWGMGDGGSAHIVVNGVEVFGYSFDNGNGGADSRVLNLSANDKVDFVLGARGGNHADGTRFNATVTKIQNASDLWVGGRDLAANEKPDGHANETTNPNPTVPQWSYGTRSTLVASGLDLMSTHINSGAGAGPDDALEGWINGYSAIAVNTGTAPVTYNFGFGPNMPCNPGEMLISPGWPSGPFPVVRWTSPAAGRYEVLAWWHDVDDHGGNGFSAHLLVNGGQVYAQDSDNGAGSSTVQSLDLKAGDQVDFLIGARGNFDFDTTKFNVAIVRPASSAGHGILPGTISPVATRTDIEANATIDWANAGANNTDLPGNPFVIESSTGVPYHVRKNTTGAFNRRNQSAGWAGNFAPGEALLTHAYSDGPVIIEAASRGGSFSAIGMQIMPSQYGPFTATIRAYDMNGGLLGTHTVNGTSNANADNSAIFIGVKSTAENIHSISVDTNSTEYGGDFAINRVSIKASTYGGGNELSNLRTNFARLVPTNSTRPLLLYPAFYQSTYAAGAPATLYLHSDVTYDSVNFAALEVSADGVTYQPLGYGTTTDGESWTFPVSTVPPGQNYYRATLRNNLREQASTHATVLITPPVVTSALVAQGEVGQPFTYTGTATGRLSGFTASSLPAWATATFDANSNTLRITGTPNAGGDSSISLQPANAAGSTAATLVLSVTNPFSNWRSSHFNAGELANPDISGPLGDATGAGIPNLIKYALGIPPKRPGNAGMPTGDVEDYGASDYLTLVYTRDKSAQGITYTVEVSGNLVTWQSGPAHTTEVSRVSHPNNTETMTVRDNIPVSTGQKRFIRLRVSQ